MYIYMIDFVLVIYILSLYYQKISGPERVNEYQNGHRVPITEETSVGYQSYYLDD